MDHLEISTPISDQITISDFFKAERMEDVVHEIYAGLSAEKKHISSRFFYDEKGSSLFEEITRLPEYYPTRTEISILNNIAAEIIGSTEKAHIIELGSGDCSKISILLDAIPKKDIKKVYYVPVDVSEAAILKSADLLSLIYPGLKIHGLLADFMKHLTELPGEKGKRLICFFGSTLGNFTRQQANVFLMEIKKLMHPGDSFLLGLDREKDINVLEDAYNDKQRVTAAFNKNILQVINQLAKTNFNPDLFEHLAYYNTEKARIEMHLKAMQEMVISSDLFPEKLRLKKGETIHTENSHKYTSTDIQDFASLTGLKIENSYSDDKEWFSLTHFKCVD